MASSVEEARNKLWEAINGYCTGRTITLFKYGDEAIDIKNKTATEVASAIQDLEDASWDAGYNRVQKDQKDRYNRGEV